MKLANLKSVQVKDIWGYETRFSKWLAQSENLALLSKEIGIEILPIGTEKSVGDFSADIFAKEADTGRIVIIENQFGKSDHDHLGKSITYAAGLDAGIIIWILEDVRSEHKQAIDWLNKYTNEQVHFFIVKIEILQIGDEPDTPKAPNFQIIAQPGNWDDIIEERQSDTALSKTEASAVKGTDTIFNSFIDAAP